MSYLTYQTASFDHLPQIEALQARYHVSTISNSDKKDGFVTTLFTTEQFKELISTEEGLSIALDGDRVVAYVMTASWHYWQKWPLFQHMISDLPNMDYLGFTLSVENSYQYGPICIDKEYRSTEVLYGIFEFARLLMVKRYPVLVTFINHINPRSYAAHVDKLGLQVLKSFEFNNNQYYCLVFDTNKPVVVLRNEQLTDYHRTEEVVRKAFWNHHAPGCDEHYLLHTMRTDTSFIDALNFVATIEDQVVGQIVYTKARIADDKGLNHEVLCFGPLAVDPDCQGKGIGGQLIRQSISRAKASGFRAVLIYGDPDYYNKYGFVAAENYDIRTSENDYADPLMAYELYADALKDIHGRFYEAEIYNVDSQAALAYDANFPPMEKVSGLPSQLRFNELVKMRRKRLSDDSNYRCD